MDHEELAKVCRALGDPTRARIFQFLLSRCCAVAVSDEGDVARMEGATAGEVCCHITGGEKVTSTVSFHLKELRSAGLITMERSGKYMVCAVDRPTLARLAVFFQEAATSADCC